MMTPTEAQIFEASTASDIAESGGQHNQKGVDFQRYWSLSRVFELETKGSPDYLFLFESVQDVLELDSSTAPITAKVYQVKKKDSGEWSWKELTGLDGPPTLKKDGKPKKKRTPKNPSKAPPFVSSPIGKLVLSVNTLPSLSVTAHFVSNAGCMVPLNAFVGGTAAAAQSCDLSLIESRHSLILEGAVAQLAADGAPPVPLSCLHLERTTVHPDQPEDALVGQVHTLLVSRSPKHAAQARSLVTALFAAVSPKGRHTGLCKDFDALRLKRGFSKADLCSALANLECVPDVDSIRAQWLAKLVSEGLNIIEGTRLSIALSRVDRDRLAGVESRDASLTVAVSEWVEMHSPQNGLLDFLRAGEEALGSQFPSVPRAQLQALLLMEGISVWVLQTSGN